MWLARRRALAKTGPGSCPFSELKSSVGEEDQNLQCVVNTTGDRGSAESPSWGFVWSWEQTRACGLWSSRCAPLGSRFTWRTTVAHSPSCEWGWGPTWLGDGTLNPYRKATLRKGLSEEPTGWVCVLFFLPHLQSQFLQHTGNNWGKRIKNLTYSPSDLFKAVFSTCWSSFQF